MPVVKCNFRQHSALGHPDAKGPKAYILVIGKASSKHSLKPDRA